MSSCSRGAISRALRARPLGLSFRSKTWSPAVAARASLLALPPRIRPEMCFATHPQHPRRSFSTSSFHQQQSSPEELANLLPTCCPGCGAYTQTIDAQEPGYYSQSRKQTRKLLALRKAEIKNEIAESVSSETIAKEDEAHNEVPLYQNELSEDVPVPTPSQGMSYTTSLLGSN